MSQIFEQFKSVSLNLKRFGLKSFHSVVKHTDSSRIKKNHCPFYKHFSVVWSFFLSLFWLFFLKNPTPQIVLSSPQCVWSYYNAQCNTFPTSSNVYTCAKNKQKKNGRPRCDLKLL